jgi:hypothetical protein
MVQDDLKKIERALMPTPRERGDKVSWAKSRPPKMDLVGQQARVP